MSDVDPQMIDQIRNDMRAGFAAFKKQAFTPMGAPGAPQLAQDPNAMPPGGAPPAGAPPMDPAAMGGMPPADPNAMPPGGAPPAGPEGGMPPADPNAAPPAGPEGGAVPPELQQMLSDLAGGVEGMSNTMKEQQSAIDQLAQRQLENEKLIQELRQELKGPQPMAGAAPEAPAAPATTEPPAGPEAAAM